MPRNLNIRRTSKVMIHHAPKDTVFGTNSLAKRTSRVYNKFAKNTLEVDIQREMR